MDNATISLKSLQTLTGHQDRVWFVVWSPQGDLLASCSSDKTIKIWGKREDGFLECQATLIDQHKRTIRSLCWSPDGGYLASAGFDSQLCLWKRGENSFDCVATMEGHENEIKCVVWDSKGEYMATCGRDKSIWIWEKDEGEEYGCSSILNGHSQDVKKVVWVPGTLILASASYDNTIKFWSQEEDDDWACIDTLKGHESTVWCIEFTKDGSLLASCSDDLLIKIWIKNEDFDGKDYYLHIATLEEYHDRSIYSCSWNSEGNCLVTSGGDDQICVFAKSESCSGETVPSFSLLEKKENAHSNDVNCVAFHPSLSVIASCSDDHTIQLWYLGNNTA